MQVLPIASGKGGVGKSLVAANLAIALAQAGKRVYLADLDLGGSNLHLILGMRGLQAGIGSFLNTPRMKFEDIIVTTEYDGLSFIPGDAEMPGTANLKTMQKRMLIRKLLALDGDFLILDLGAGTTYNILDLFLVSRGGIVITTPTPTALLAAYLFLKNVVFRIIYATIDRSSPAFGYLEGLRKDGGSLRQVYIPRLIERIRAEDPAGHDACLEILGKFHPRLVLNMLEDPADTARAQRLRRSCRQYLDLDMEHLGIIYRDDLQDIALSSRLPIISYKPRSVLSQAIYRLADKLLHADEAAAGPLELSRLDESYQTADLEAEADFEARLRHIEEMLHCGTLSTGDLVETIKTQQFEIGRLRQENQLLKTELVKSLQRPDGTPVG